MHTFWQLNKAWSSSPTPPPPTPGGRILPPPPLPWIVVRATEPAKDQLEDFFLLRVGLVLVPLPPVVVFTVMEGGAFFGGHPYFPCVSTPVLLKVK